jgi:site-specific DNA recombinase
LLALIADREDEKARLQNRLKQLASAPGHAKILPHQALMKRFRYKVSDLQMTLDKDDRIRAVAANVLSVLIESVTIYPGAERGVEAEVVAKLSDLMAFSTNDNAASKGGSCSSMRVVAGAGFEPATFRL